MASTTYSNVTHNGEIEETVGKIQQEVVDMNCFAFRLERVGNCLLSVSALFQVNAKNSWEELTEKFNDLSKCVNGCVALKQIYLR